jgi:hypothetical protein
MSVDTYVDQARTRVRAERKALGEMVDAYESFCRRVQNLPADGTASTGVGKGPTATTHLSTDAGSADDCRPVRVAFVETIRPHSVVDVDGEESVLETIRAEFTDAIALALAPKTDTRFTPALKSQVLAAAQSRRSETRALQTAVERERDHLEETADVVETVTTWLVSANETPLSALGFKKLKHRHETLASHRDRCEQVARERQALLRATTSDGVDVGVSHRTFIRYLYQELPVDHPVLATITKLEETCRSCQRIVRDQLIRRV